MYLLFVVLFYSWRDWIGIPSTYRFWIWWWRQCGATKREALWLATPWMTMRCMTWKYKYKRDPRRANAIRKVGYDYDTIQWWLDSRWDRVRLI